MDKKDRVILKDLNKRRIENLAIPIRKATAAKDALNQAMAKFTGREVNDMFTAEYRDGEIARAKQAYRSTLAALHKEIETTLTELQSSLEEQHSQLDMENPAWQNALKMIEMGGKDLSGDTVRLIVQEFKYDQPALAALQSIFKASGMAYDGGIDQMRYDIPSTLNKLQSVARDTFLSEDSSPFQFGVAAGKIAKFEGVDFPMGNPFPSMAMEPSKFDADKVVESARAGAGLNQVS